MTIRTSTKGGGAKLIQRGSFAATNTSGLLSGAIPLPIDVDPAKTTITHLGPVGTTTRLSTIAGSISAVDTLTIFGNHADASAAVTIKWEIKELF